jgi:Fe-S cluster assembly ATPase SufC
MKTRLEVDCSTGEEKIIELTQDEILEQEAAIQRAIQQQLDLEAQISLKESAKKTAEEKLSALGLTKEEIAALSN